MPTFRLHPFAVADGPANMAADEVLLEAAEAGRAGLRFYGWSEPTLSLGDFQPAAERLPGVAWVRRASGGTAILHDHELTYALALPAGLPWQRAGESWVCRFHALIAAELAGAGVAARAVACGEEQKLGPALCFLNQTAGDLVLGGQKVCGSAQRRRHGALLQHGSLLFGRSVHAPQLPGLGDLTEWATRAEALAGRLAKSFSVATGWQAEEGEWSAAERLRIDLLRAEKYAAHAWNHKR